MDEERELADAVVPPKEEWGSEWREIGPPPPQEPPSVNLISVARGLGRWLFGR